MMVERTFAIGGWLCLGSAALFIAGIVASDAFVEAPELLLTPLLFGVMGGMFLYASAQARADRRALLLIGSGPEREPSSPPRP
jgi:hypothetical protein